MDKAGNPKKVANVHSVPPPPHRPPAATPASSSLYNPCPIFAPDNPARSMPFNSTANLNRTIFVVYSYFNILNLSFNIPPALLNSEMELPLPCTEKEWTADTPEDWAECHKLGRKGPEAAFSRTLHSLLSLPEPSPVPCSTLGGYIALHAILQQIWHIRQASPDKPAELATVEITLKKWQAMYMAHPEFPLSTQNPYDPLVFNSGSLLRLAYIRLVVDFSRVNAMLMSQNANAISHAIVSHPRDIPRSPMDTKAVMYAIDALRMPMKLGFYPPARSGTCSALLWSLQHHLFSLECCKCHTRFPSVCVRTN